MIKRRKNSLKNYRQQLAYKRQIQKNQEDIASLAQVIAKLAVAKHTLAETIADHTTAINILTVYYDNLKNLLIEGGILQETPVKDLDPLDSLEGESDIQFTTFLDKKGKKDFN